MELRQIVNPHDPIQIRDMNEMFRELYTITARNNALLSKSTGGWISTNCEWTRTETKTMMYIISADGDKSSFFSIGMRVRISHSSNSYFIIVNVEYSAGQTHLDLFRGLGSDVSEDVYSDVCYSREKAPVGFPLDPRKWSIRTEKNFDIQRNDPGGYTWHYFGSNTYIFLPKGLWRLRYSLVADLVDTSTSQKILSINAGLSDNQTSVSISNSVSRSYIEMHSAGGKYCEFYFSREVVFEQNIAGYIYLLGKTCSYGTDFIRWRGVVKPTVIEAECAYV